MAEQIRKFLQDWNDLLVGLVDLSAVKDPSNPDKKIRMYVHGSYSRTVTFAQYPNIKITIEKASGTVISARLFSWLFSFCDHHYLNTPQAVFK